MLESVGSSGVCSWDGTGLERLRTYVCEYGSARIAKLVSMAALQKPRVDTGCTLVDPRK